MGRNNYFRFKQFKIIQDRSAMKVGTDGVLLGAWTSVEGAGTILDVGAGTGLIALMMAQRAPKAVITGVEYEQEAAAEALFNAENSPWSDRISIIHSSFQEFAQNHNITFDLIVSNPPFFINSHKPKSGNLAIAKHNHLLPLDDLAAGASKLLSPVGTFSVILPASSTAAFITLAEKEGLYLKRETIIRPNNLKLPHRHLVEFSSQKVNPLVSNLNIHQDDGNDYTPDYKLLTRDFYLNF